MPADATEKTVTTAQISAITFSALAYAAGTLIQVGTRPTPYVSTLELAAPIDLGART